MEVNNKKILFRGRKGADWLPCELSIVPPEFPLMSAARLELFRAAKAEPASITALAQRLHRDRSSVKKDVDILAAAGLLDIE